MEWPTLEDLNKIYWPSEFIRAMDKMPKMMIVSPTGHDSFVVLNGIVFGLGVKEVEYKHTAMEPPRLKIDFDVNEAKFSFFSKMEVIPHSKEESALGGDEADSERESK